MIVPGSVNPLLLASAAAAGGLQVSRSLRFNGSVDSAYLSRTPASAGNRRTWTWSGWAKRSKINSSWVPLFEAYDGSSLAEANYLQLTFYSDQIGLATDTVWLRRTTAVYRDYSAWMHVVCAFDTTQSTGADRVKIYVNGAQVTAFTTSSDPTINTDYGVNRNVEHKIGRRQSTDYFDGYLADVYFIDGQALTPASFAETDATTGQWIPKAFSGGSYGTNGFYLKFDDNSSNTASTLGKDTSGLGNNWTPNNFSVSEYPRSTDLISSVSLNTPSAGRTTVTFAGASGLGALSSGKRIYQSNASLVNTSISGTIKQFNTSNPHDAIYGDPWDGDTSTILSLGSLWLPTPSNYAGVILTPSTGVAYSTLRVYARTGTNGTITYGVSVNNGAWLGSTGSIGEGWVNCGGPGTLTSLRVGNINTGGGFQPYWGWAAIELDGQILVNNQFLPGAFVVSTSGSQVVLRDVVGTLATGQTLVNPTVDTVNQECDSLRDSPSNSTSSPTASGNYCTFNPLIRSYGSTSSPGNGTASLLNGNLALICGYAFTGSSVGTVGFRAGKFYWEIAYSDGGVDIGIAPSSSSSGSLYPSGAYLYASGGSKWSSSGGSQSYGTAFTAECIIGVAVDLNAGKVWFSKDGVWQSGGDPASGTGEAFSGLNGEFVPFVQDNYYYSGSKLSANFGQRSFIFSAPSGFLSLCTTNLPAPLVTKSNTVMDVALYTGNGGTQSITGLAFNPDFVWLKRRSSAQAHYLYDVIRGTSSVLYSDGTDAEQSISTGLTSFNSDGFSLGSLSGVNASGSTYVGWAWDAGTTTTTINANAYSAGVPSITSQVRANASAGFSIVTYTGTGSAATVGHGLGVAPSLLIVKQRNAARPWEVYHKDLGASYYLELNVTNAKGGPYSGLWNDTAPTSTVFSILNDGGSNASGGTYVAYCFAPVTGYSNAFSYSGNGSSDGPFVYLGFRPRLILLKVTNTTGPWYLFDTARNTYNVMNNRLEANSSSAEASDRNVIDALSNGFKLRDVDAVWNQNGNTYVGFAWAESPLNYSRAR